MSPSIPLQPENIKWNNSAATYYIFLKFETEGWGTKPKLKIACNYDYIQILKVEYLSNNIVDLPQLLN
jgi:hypothetical protein